MAVAATAAVPARPGAHLVLGRQPAKLQCFIHVLVNRLLQVMEFFLGVEKTPRDGILHQSIAVLFEIGNFLPTQSDCHLLFLLQRLALLHEVIVIRSRLFVAHKSVDSLANGLHAGLIQYGLAQFTGFLHYGRFFDGRLHNQ